MTTTRQRSWLLPAVVMGVALSLVAIGSSGWLSDDKRHSRAVTLSAVWGDGTQVAGGAHITWHTTSGGNVGVIVKGRVQPKVGRDTGTEHFIETIMVRSGDQVILACNPDDPKVPAGTTITINGVEHAGGHEARAVVP